MLKSKHIYLLEKTYPLGKWNHLVQIYKTNRFLAEVNYQTSISLQEVYQDLIQTGFKHDKYSCELPDIETWISEKYSLAY